MGTAATLADDTSTGTPPPLSKLEQRMDGSLGALVKATGAVLVVRAADVAFMGAAAAWADGAIASVMRALGG